MKTASILLGLLGLACHTAADTTWPSSIDELEEIMFQLESFRARKFADTVNPCSNEAAGPGRQNAAEWLRAAFHDMSTANTYFGTGGLDASLQYELNDGENTGPGHTTTLEFMAPYLTTKSSLADLIALGVYTSVRSCGGPVVSIRTGRIDATEAGALGVPQPQNSAYTFMLQFERLGFSVEEMIQVTACGHTIGGVHSPEFPQIVPPNSTAEGEAPLDSTVATFDNKVVTEYLDGTTQNPLVVGPSVAIGYNSDFKVFNYDNNATMETLTDPTNFTSVCQTILQKMIEVVPPFVNLTSPITPYMVKPVDLQLTVADGGSSLSWTGYIRVRTTNLPKENIDSVTITYKNRAGGTSCGAGGCVFNTTIQGISQGFDDTFAWFPIEQTVPAATGISSFTLAINLVGGASQAYTNNGEAYPLQDAVMFQMPQSCVLGSTGAFTVTAAVRNDRLASGASAFVSFKMPQDDSPVPALQNATVALTKGACAGAYTFYSTQYTIPGGLAYEAKVDLINGDQVDAFKSVVDVGGTCMAFANPATCSGVTVATSMSTSKSTSKPTSKSSSSSKATSSIKSTSSVKSTAKSTSTTSKSSTKKTTSKSSTSLKSSSSTTSKKSTSSTAKLSTSTTPTKTTKSTASTTSKASATASLHHRSVVGGYKMVSCWTEGNGTRALAASSYAADDMTLESCMSYCSSYVYWGTEYGRECYCGNTLASSSDAAPIGDCDTVCAGDATEYCGAGNRLELYSTTATVTATPTPAITHRAAAGNYSLVGCWTEGNGVRALNGASTSSADMSNTDCSEFCNGYRYFGTEYASQCYCGSYLASSSSSAPLSDCNMVCSGAPSEYCGAGNRLELYMDPNFVGGPPQQPAAAGSFTWLGCQTEVDGARTLSGNTTTSDDMTNEVCAAFCGSYEYFGTEYGSQCYCGNTLPAASESVSSSECGMQCSGSALELCGGSDTLSVYQMSEVTP